MNGTKVLLIYTGGTIGMVEDHVSESLHPFDFDHIKNELPELRKMQCKIEAIAFNNPIDSSDMNPGVWNYLGGLIEGNYDAFDGFVILHGTDTMAFTASALSFMLEGLNKPVILTGSQLPIGVLRTDGKENLITAIEIAMSKDHMNRSMVPEVGLYFEHRLLRGNRSHKMSAERFNAFDSPNYPPLAEAGTELRFFRHLIRKPDPYDFRYTPLKDCEIGVITLYPGISSHQIDRYLQGPEKYYILQVFGSGNAPTTPSFTEAIARAVNRGKLVLSISQCEVGSSTPSKYTGAKELRKAGVVLGYDLTFEAAVTKLMYLDSIDLSMDQIRMYLQRDIRGEMSIGEDLRTKIETIG